MGTESYVTEIESEGWRQEVRDGDRKLGAETRSYGRRQEARGGDKTIMGQRQEMEEAETGSDQQTGNER